MDKIKAINIIIERDPMTKIPKTVKPWEVPIYRSQYGDEKVQIVGDPVVFEGELPEAQEEYYRLRLVFGIDTDTKQSHTDLVYGRGQDGIDKLEKAIKASAAGDFEAAQKLIDGKGKVSPDVAEARENAKRDPLADEFTTQSQADIVGAAAGGPGDVSNAGGKNK